MPTRLCIGTKKGAFILEGDKNRSDWNLQDPIYFGNIIYHFVPDPRTKLKMLIAAKTGHLGPTIFVSDDEGKSWIESKKPPVFENNDRIVNFVFWISPGHSSEPEVWYAGTSPQGLFKSEDGGMRWFELAGFANHELIKEIVNDNEGTPIGPLLHSINIDPRDKHHICLAMSLGGFIESMDGGDTWRAFNKNVLADFLPNQYPEWGQCVHNMQLHPKNPDLVYQQGHCGVYKINLKLDEKWTRIGDNLPKAIGDMGFPLIVHPRDEDTVWVVPMDSTDV